MSEWRKVLRWTGSQWTPTAFSEKKIKKIKKPEAFHYSKVRALKQHFKCYPAVQDHEKPLISCKWTARSMGLNVNECFFCVAAEVEAGREREREEEKEREEGRKKIPKDSLIAIWNYVNPSARLSAIIQRLSLPALLMSNKISVADI